MDSKVSCNLPSIYRSLAVYLTVLQVPTFPEVYYRSLAVYLSVFKSPVYQQSPVVSLVSRSLYKSTQLYSRCPVVPEVSYSLPCLYRSLGIHHTVFQVPSCTCNLLQSLLSLQISSSPPYYI